jgi:AraC-like DNA-binding protein
VNHQFDKDTSVSNVHQPGICLSMLGKCQAQTLNKGMQSERDLSHHYFVAVVDEACPSHMHFPQNSTWQTLSILLPLEHLHKSSILSDLHTNVPHQVPQIRLAEIGSLPLDILQCCEAVWQCTMKGFERELFIRAKAQEALALFLHQHRQMHEVNATPRVNQLNEILHHVQTNLGQEWSLSSVARLAGSNRTYVKQDIKALIGLSFRDWLKQARIDAARVQLSGEEPIAEIAHNVGFKSQAHFATLFKSELGVTPSEYRQSLSMKNSA